MNLIETYVYGKNDTRIFCRKDIPASAKAIIVVAHGYLEHSGRYITFAEKLVAHGLGVCLIDHRGNGRSEGTRGDVDDFFDFVEDIQAVVAKMQRHEKSVIVFGHSMGGLINFLHALKYPQSAMARIYSSPALGVPIGCKNLPEAFYEGAAHIAGQAKIHRGGIFLSTPNQAYLEQFKHDTVGNNFSTVKFMDQFLRIGVGYAMDHAGEYGCPALFLLGDKDRVIPIDRNRHILESIGYEDKKVIEYPGCMHDLLHELEEHVEKVTQDIIAWIDERLTRDS